MKIVEWTDEQKKQWADWVTSRPPVIQELAARLPPDRLYRLATSGHRVNIYAYNEDGTLTVQVTGKYNRVLFARSVFGITPQDLIECDGPAPGEDVGDTAEQAGCSDQDIREILIPRLVTPNRRRHGFMTSE